MSPPSRRESSGHEGPKLFRWILALLVVGAAIVWGGASGHETPVAQLATRLSDRWDQSVARAPHVLPPLLHRSESGSRGKITMEDAGILGSQAAPSLGGRIRGARKAQ